MAASWWKAKKERNIIHHLKLPGNMAAVKILYVEDELFLGKIVKESLESRSYEVLMEADGNKAFSLFAQHRPDICVLDVMLPIRRFICGRDTPGGPGCTDYLPPAKLKPRTW